MDQSRESAPTYELCTLVSQLSEEHAETQIQCAQALGPNLYVGCSNGLLLRYTLQQSIDGTLQYIPISEQASPSNSPIESIQLAPSINRAFVLSNGVVSLFTLPGFQRIPTQSMHAFNGVLSFAINETPNKNEPIGIALVKRTGISFWEIGSKANFIRDISLPSIMNLKRTGSSLCLADTEQYRVLDLQALSVTPIHDISLVNTFKVLPIIEVSKPDEYLCVACTYVSDDMLQKDAIGIFFNGRGDPTDAPVEWKGMPESICVDKDYIVTLYNDLFAPMPKAFVKIQKRGEQGYLQSLDVPSGQPDDFVRSLALSRFEFCIPTNSRQEKLLMKRIPLFEPPVRQPTASRKHDEAEGFNEPAGSGLTPPPTPRAPAKPPSRPHSRSRGQGRSGNSYKDSGDQGLAETLSQLPTAAVLLVTSKSVYALLPSNLLSQIEGLLNDGRVKDAASLLSQAYSKYGKEGHLAADFRYLNIRIGICYLLQTAFENAGDAFFRGDMDPRWLIALWEEWAPLIKQNCPNQEEGEENAMLDIFSGLEPHYRSLRETSIKEIVSRSLVENYSPYLPPSTNQSSTGQEIRITLEWSARSMLEKYLRKFRTKREFVGMTDGGRSGETSGPQEIYLDDRVNKIVDTVSVLIYSSATDEEELQSLQNLLDTSPFLQVEDIRDSLITNNRVALLARLYERKIMSEEKCAEYLDALLDLYVKLVEGSLVDNAIPDPMTRIKRTLKRSNDRALVNRYAMWLIKRDPTGGLELLISDESKNPRTAEEDLQLLAQVKEASPKAALLLLEYLVLQKQTKDSALHTRLALSYLDTVISHLESSPTSLEDEMATIQSYLESKSQDSTPFLHYLAFGAQPSDRRTLRLKLLLLLQGSNQYSLEEVRRRMQISGQQVRKALALEMAILSSKTKDHKAALSILVKDLQDSVTAEAYCSLGGKVIPPKVAASIGERLKLGEWAALVLRGDERSRSTSAIDVSSANGTSTSAVELTRMLLEVYMNAGEVKVSEATKLLNAQAVNVDVQEIVPLMPNTWPLQSVSTFLARSFRRSLHHVYEGQILKQLSAGQNLQTSELAFEVFAEAGVMIEESNEDMPKGDGDDEGEETEENPNANGTEIDSSEVEELRARIGEKLVEKGARVVSLPPTRQEARNGKEGTR